jgi:hypothetical protein
MCSGEFTIQEVARELQYINTKDYTNLRQILSRSTDARLIERIGRKDGIYRKVEEPLSELAWWEGSSEEYEITLPLEMSEYCKLYPKNIVVFAGEKNAAKTALALNTAKLNMNRTQVRYFTSEMGVEELRSRLEAFEDIPTSEWRKVRFFDHAENFQDHIGPEDLNIIDFLEIHDEFWRVGQYIRSIYERLTKGIAIICLQKKTGSDVGRGGEITVEKARLALALSTLQDNNGMWFNRAKFVKLKTPRDHRSKPEKKVCDFRIHGGSELSVIRDWGDEPYRRD